MKKLFKTLAALAVVAALGFGFVSCGGGDDDSSSGGGNSGNSGNNNTNPAQTGTALAVFTCDSGYDKRTLTFNEDSTFKVIVSDETGSQAEGTYTFDSGDWENGTITLTATSGDKDKRDTFTGTKTITEKQITFSTKTYTLTGGTKKAPSKNSEPDTKKDDEENKGQETTTETATFTSTEFYGGTIKIEYKADGSYLMTWSLSGYTTNKGKGTYTLTGTFDNGTIHQHQTHSSDTLGTGWVAEAEDNDLVVTNGSFNVQLEDEDGVETVTFTKTTADESDNENDSGDEEEASTSAAFAGERYGYKFLIKFNNDTYVIYLNGKEDEKGTYTLTGNFKNGTIKLTKTQRYEYGYDGNGEWKEEKGTTDCEITDGSLKIDYQKFETVSYDYDVSQDLPPVNVNIHSNLYGASVTYDVRYQSVKVGEKVTKPETPVADGFIFDNWYSDKELTTLFDFDKPISTEEYREYLSGKWYLHIYGKWTVDSDFKDNWTLEITNNDTKETVTNDYEAAIKALKKASSGSTIKISGLLIDYYTSNIDNYYGELRSELNGEYNLDLSELSIREKKSPDSSDCMYNYYYGEGCWNVGYYDIWGGHIWKDSGSRIKTLKTPKSGDFEVESLPNCTEITLTKGTKKFYMAKRASENLKSFSFEDEEGWVQVGRSDWDKNTQRPISELYQDSRYITSFMTSWVKNHDNIKFENTRS